MTLQPLVAGHTLRLLRGGAEFFPALVEAIDHSRQEVRLETYIFHFDPSGEAVAAALIRAAHRGVAVYLVMDGVGTPPLPAGWIRQFSVAKVQWHRFAPLGPLGWLIPVGWRRLHRKLCVVDARIAFCGGINILDDYRDLGGIELETPRFDFAVQVSGPLVQDTQRSMARFWERLQITHQLEQLAFKDAHKTWKDSTMPARAAKKSAKSEVFRSGVHAMLVLRDNLRNRRSIERAYRKALADARHEVILSNAYFLPGGKLRRALIHAARRGVRVRLLLPGIHEHILLDHATRPVFGALLAAGIEIHEYAGGFLHAKVAVVDAHWATVGSSNLDPLSLLLAREANVVVDDAAFAQELRQCLVSAIETQSQSLDYQAYANRPWQQRVFDWLTFGTVRLLLLVSASNY